MKRIMAMLLAIGMLFSFAACSSNAAGQTNATSESTEKKEEFKFEEVVVVDNDECLVKITGVKRGFTNGLEFSVYLENKTADKKLGFKSSPAIVDENIQVESYLIESVLAGKKMNTDITFWEYNSYKEKITDFSDIEFEIIVSDENDYSAPPVAKEKVKLYPYGKDKAVKYVREDKQSDYVLLNNEYIKIVATDWSYDEKDGVNVNLYFLNKTDKTLYVYACDTYLNDYSTYASLLMDEFYGGKIYFENWKFSTLELEENGITSFEKLEFNYELHDPLTYQTLAEGTLTLKP